MYHAPLRDKLYEIQHVHLSDKPKILLDVGGVNKPLDSLSLGQRCTTLLSVIMLESDLPLIVDTPEAGLDNIFVFDSVVKNLRTIKETRQVILATHNANIPVSGDAEQIFCLDSDGKKGWTTCSGSIDQQNMKESVQKVLEGGKKAFILRKKKYGY
jgi:ABC-type Mn2+/Zn2+ transport system ATPase subunit